MTVFHGRLFGPGLPGSGVPARGCWQDDAALLLEWNDGALRGRGVAVAAGGFNHGVLRLDWQDAAGAYAFCVEGEGERTACLATAPPALAEGLRTAAGRRGRVERRFRLGWAALVLLLLLPFIAGGVLLLNLDRVAAWAVARIPAAQEVQLGELVLAQTRAALPLRESGPAVEALRQIGARLTVGSPYRYRWLVAEAPTVNAFAAPGGVVVVHSGLLRAVATPEELAGVLAHEIAHVELRHSLTALVKSLGLRTLLAVALGDLSGSAVVEAAQRLTELGYSREAEREADREGLRRLTAARIDPAGLLAFFATLEQQATVAPPAFLSSHPATAERIAALRGAVAELRGDWTPLAVDLAELRAGLPERLSE